MGDMPILTSMARGRLRLSLRLSPRPRLILTSCTDMDSDTMDMDSDTMEDTSDTMADSDTTDTARGLLMLRLIPTFFMEDTLDTPDTSDTMDTDTADTSTANRLITSRYFSEPSAESWT